MEKQAYDKLCEVEEQHWYHDGCKKLVEIYLKNIKRKFPNTIHILDVGCGTGGMFDLLGKYGDVTGIEISEYAIQLCQEKHSECNVIKGSANELKKFFKEESFDLITVFNVLYHKDIKEDTKVLEEAYSILKPSGYIILYNPAFKCLYRKNDKICGGIRRYSARDIRNIMNSVGFVIIINTYFNAISFFPVLTVKLLERFKNFNADKEVVELNIPPTLINNLLKIIMTFERLCIKLFKSIPFGVSVFSIGKKIDANKK